MPSTAPWTMIRPRRRIAAMSAVLLPFAADGTIDWPYFRAHLLRTLGAGLIPAVNMDTGYVAQLEPAVRRRILEEAKTVLSGQPYVAGAWVGNVPRRLLLENYQFEVAQIQALGGLPIIFQAPALTELPQDQALEVYRNIGRNCTRFLAFELGTMFAPFGRIYDLEIFTELVKLPQCVGLKHSSLSRRLEWQRLEVRDKLRPSFLLLTGNDLAIDMVMYGSDYLLGLSTFAPDLFARRDAFWEQGDPSFYDLNDALQALGHFAFRAPVPAYKHTAAMFLKLRGWLPSDRPCPGTPERPASDLEVLRELLGRLQPWIDSQA